MAGAIRARQASPKIARHDVLLARGRELRDEDSMAVLIFLSHSTQDDPLAHQLARGLIENGIAVLVDPFDPGDRTCAKAQKTIKTSSHFVLFFTESCIKSRWVRIESRFAKICYDLGAMTILPIAVDGAQPYPFLEQFIGIRWNTDDGLGDLERELSANIDRNTHAGSLFTDAERAEREKEGGRELERQHATTGDVSILHDAVDAYDKAIQLDFCNHHAWANKAWSLCKLGERNRALDLIAFAKLLRPDSQHVLDVKARIDGGCPPKFFS
jgi:hypothetical protein